MPRDPTPPQDCPHPERRQVLYAWKRKDTCLTMAYERQADVWKQWQATITVGVCARCGTRLWD